MKINEAIAQGEVYIKRIADMPDTEGCKAVEKTAKGYILAHSESGHHHLLTGGEVLERPVKSEASQRFIAKLTQTEEVIQDASSPHGKHTLPAGIYDIRISREYNPFLEEARKVAD